MQIDIDEIAKTIIKIVKSSTSDDEAQAHLEAYLIQLDVVGIKNCKQCNEVFVKVTKWQKFCCEECKLTYHSIKHGKPFDAKMYANYRKAENDLTSIVVGDGILVRPKRRIKI
jgi:protein-arginine kinase activator protein McsA